MPSHCASCGHALRGDEKFCSECGAPAGGASPPPQPDQWMYCEITWVRRGFLGGRSYFWARDMATGAEIARGTRVFSPMARAIEDVPAPGGLTDMALAEVVGMLVSSGWEPLPGNGPYWWSQRFRHVVVR